MILTEDEIEAGRSAKGGWTRKTLEGWGVLWPPPKGWRRELLGKPPRRPQASPAQKDSLKPPSDVWTTKDGRRIPLMDMSDAHLENTISKLRGWLDRLEGETERRQDARVRRLSEDDGDDAPW